MRMAYIELFEEKHPLCFSLAVYEELTDEYGSIDNVFTAIRDKDRKTALRAVNKVLRTMMKAGRIHAAYYSEPLPPEFPEKLYDAIGIFHLAAVNAITKAITNDLACTINIEGGKGKGHAGQFSSAWIYFNGAKAGLTRPEVRNLPLGQVLDQIACCNIAEHGAKERRTVSGSLFEQMTALRR